MKLLTTVLFNINNQHMKLIYNPPPPPKKWELTGSYSILLSPLCHVTVTGMADTTG